MFLFHWFNVFQSEYRNGLADGAAVSLLFWVAVALFRIYYIWSEQYAGLRREVEDLFLFAEARTLTEERALRFQRLIAGSGLIGNADKLRLAPDCERIVTAARMPTNYTLPERDRALDDLRDWINTVEFRPAFFFFRRPWRNLRFCLGGFFGR